MNIKLKNAGSAPFDLVLKLAEPAEELSSRQKYLLPWRLLTFNR